jgi:hypothetical protein
VFIAARRAIRPVDLLFISYLSHSSYKALSHLMDFAHSPDILLQALFEILV